MADGSAVEDHRDGFRGLGEILQSSRQSSHEISHR